MSSASAMSAGKANRGSAEAGPSTSHSGAIIDAFQKIFLSSARKTLARFLGLSEGGARKKIEGDRELSLDEFATLLRTDDGFHYLTAVMADSQVKWWRICRPMMEVAAVTEMQLTARRKLKRAVAGALDADTDLTAAIARADALLIHDPDFHSPNADAVRAVARLSHRPVAAPARRK